MYIGFVPTIHKSKMTEITFRHFIIYCKINGQISTVQIIGTKMLIHFLLFLLWIDHRLKTFIYHSANTYWVLENAQKI